MPELCIDHLPEVIGFSSFFQALDEGRLGVWIDPLRSELAHVLARPAHGDFGKWLSALAELPDLESGRVELDSDRVSVSAGGNNVPDEAGASMLERCLHRLHPWRKGPFHLHGIDIDAEWRSDWKWRRLAGEIEPLKGRLVLDVGSGNGYYCWRMRGAGARLVVGLDPNLLYFLQFQAVRRYIAEGPVQVLPLAFESLPSCITSFDTVFSMGLLYHRREPLEHLRALCGRLRPAGQLVLETLVIDDEDAGLLKPAGRYARMRNVWFLPSVPLLQDWLHDSGFRRIRLVDVTATSVREQRSTPWMRFKSLRDFLDPADPSQTVEGLPAPRRAILLAQKPD